VLHFAVDSRIGRQPNALKHATFLQLSRIKSEKGITSSAEPFAVLETKPDFVEADGNGTTCTAANSSPDHTVTTSRDSQMLAGGQKKPRRPYRRRSVKVTAEISDDSAPLHYIDSTQSHLSPVEIKQETLSPVDCNVGELFDQLGVELVEDFDGCGQQRLIEKRPECGSQSAGNADGVVGSVECGGGYPESEPTGEFQACASGSAEPRPDPWLNVPKHDCVNTAVPVPTASGHTVTADYNDVVSSMQRAFYDLLPILHRVRRALLIL